MEEVRSRDGTKIAFDRLGEGPPLILVFGAFSYRKFPKSVELAELLARRFTVVNYDRRGRGDSGDTPPFAVEREIEDLEALIEAAGGSAYLWGWSSGAVLALRAAAAGLDVKKVIAYDPIFLVDEDGSLPPPDFAERLDELVAADRRSEAARYFMTDAMGVPRLIVGAMRLLPMWSRLKRVAHTLPYDFAVTRDTVTGKRPAAEDWTSLTVPTLVMYGAKAPERLRRGAEAIAAVLPNAQLRALEGQSHNPSMKVMAPAVEEFFLGSPRERQPAGSA
jgi:pimeloyl-ACP methyl ester carboxylesterase